MSALVPAYIVRRIAHFNTLSFFAMPHSSALTAQTGRECLANVLVLIGSNNFILGRQTAAIFAKFWKGTHMGVFNSMLGNASKIDPDKIQQEFQQILAPEERVEHAYQLIRDYFVFTNRRLVLVDKQGMTGSKVEYHSLPYRSITHFSIETAGTFELDAELKIWISGNPVAYQKQFNKKLNIYEVQAVLASYVLK